VRRTIAGVVRQPPRRQLLLASATVVYLLVRVALSAMPFGWFRRGVDGVGPLPPAVRPSWTPSEIGWAVGGVATALPGTGTCLPAALTAYLLLRETGHDAEVRVGVTPGGRSVHAHSWVVHDGAALVGDEPRLDRYESLGVVLPREEPP